MSRDVSFGSSSESKRYADMRVESVKRQRVEPLQEVYMGESSESFDGLDEVYKAREAVEGAMEDEQFQRSARYRRVARVANADPDDNLFNPNGLPLTNVPVCSPFFAELKASFGKRIPGEKCFGCDRGIGIVPLTTEELRKLETLIIELVSPAEITSIVEQVYTYYVGLREKYNVNVKKEQQLPAWSRWKIFDHIFKHNPTLNAYNAYVTAILQNHIDVLLEDGGVYSVPVHCVENGSNRKVVNESGHKMLMQTIDRLPKFSRTIKGRGAKYDPSTKVVYRAITAKANTIGNLRTGIGSSKK